MKLVIRLGAAAALVALSACAQEGQGEGEASGNMDAGAGMTANESVLPVEDNAAGTDTLGNQLNQLNEMDATGGNTTENAAANTAENTTNSY